jgi:hypothetical protein
MINEIESKLKQLKRNKQYIALSLHPAIGNTTIEREGNRMFINEGRDGKWEDISEQFYDTMVEKYDSRSNTKWPKHLLTRLIGWSGYDMYIHVIIKLKHMTPRQYMEMERQATVTQTRVQRFIELQTQVNNLIDSTDGPTDQLIQLTGELELLGDSLNDNEIREVVEWYNSRQEIEWGIE